MKKITFVFVFVGLFFLSVPGTSHAATAATVSSPFYYTFNSAGILFEAGSMLDTTSPYWWVDSGAEMIATDGGLGETVQGSLATTSPWRTLYSVNNPLDTDNGFHPQNIFRLLTRSTWQNVREQAIFKIAADNISASPNRDVSNGLLFFSRYADHNNTYYSGIRVDGAAVIKKKVNGIYYTLAYKKIYSGTYDRKTNPTLLPHNVWIGMRSETTNNADGSVTINLYTDVGQTGTWTLVLSAKDDGVSFGGKALTASAQAGIRTDFMDVQFDNYRLENM